VVQRNTAPEVSEFLASKPLLPAQAVVHGLDKHIRSPAAGGRAKARVPVLPAAEGPLGIGASTTVTLTLDVPATVTRFSLTEGGTLQDGSGHIYNYSLAQTVIP